MTQACELACGPSQRPAREGPSCSRKQGCVGQGLMPLSHQASSPQDLRLFYEKNKTLVPV